MIDTQTKYGFNYPVEMVERNIIRLTHQMWKLIPMLENNEDWQKQAETVILEVVGLREIFLNQPPFLQLLAKLEGLITIEDNFSLYRKTVFEAISLLRGLIKNETE